MLPVLFFSATVFVYDSDVLNMDVVEIYVPSEVVAVEFEFEKHSTKYDLVNDLNINVVHEEFSEEEYFTRKIYVYRKHLFHYVNSEGEKVYFWSHKVSLLVKSKKDQEIKRIWLWLKNKQRIQGTNLGSLNPSSRPLNTLPN